eukprot:COSAG01_NODE_6055_length_3878_cov_1.602805_2_plen_526_part_00
MLAALKSVLPCCCCLPAWACWALAAVGCWALLLHADAQLMAGCCWLPPPLLYRYCCCALCCVTPADCQAAGGRNLRGMGVVLPLLAVLAATAAAETVREEVERLRAEYEWPAGKDAIDPVPPGADGQECAVNKVAYEYALQLQPQLAPLLAVFDALELGTKCKVPRPPPPPPLPPPSFPASAGALYVDAAKGTDSAPGTQAQPLRSVRAALTKCEGKDNATIILRGGVHFLTQTLAIGPRHSGLTLQNFAGEEVWLSGGVPLTAQWARGKGNMKDLFVAQTSLTEVPGLNRLTYADPLHARMTRARFPNKVPSTTMEHGLAQSHGTSWHKPPGWGDDGFNVSRTVNAMPPNGTEPFDGTGNYFTYGVGGWSCSRYSPAGGFWCSNQSSGGGSGWELMVPGAPLFPVALELDSAVWGGEGGLLAKAGVPDPSTWQSQAGAVIETWTNGWSTTFWEVTDITGGAGRNSTFVFGGAGGQQSGRGFHIDPPCAHDPSGKQCRDSQPISTEGGWKIENAIVIAHTVIDCV